MGAVTLALVPVFPPFLATVHGIERLGAGTVLGGAPAAVGIAVVRRERLGGTVPLVSIAALVAGALCAAESGVVIKYFPRSHPAATNAAAMGIGPAALLVVSRIGGEAWVIPQQTTTLIAYAYIVTSTIVLFVLVLYILGRWTASAASLQFPIAPLVTVIAANALAGEGVTFEFLIGAVVVAAGVLVASGIAFTKRPVVVAAG